MIIVRYDINDGINEVREIYYELQKLDLKDKKILFLPQDFDILFNCSTADLYYFKEQIENAIHDKEVAEA